MLGFQLTNLAIYLFYSALSTLTFQFPHLLLMLLFFLSEEMVQFQRLGPLLSSFDGMSNLGENSRTGNSFISIIIFQGPWSPVCKVLTSLRCTSWLDHDMSRSINRCVHFSAVSRACRDRSQINTRHDALLFQCPKGSGNAFMRGVVAKSKRRIRCAAVVICKWMCWKRHGKQDRDEMSFFPFMRHKISSHVNFDKKNDYVPQHAYAREVIVLL